MPSSLSPGKVPAGTEITGGGWRGGPGGGGGYIRTDIHRHRQARRPTEINHKIRQTFRSILRQNKRHIPTCTDRHAGETRGHRDRQTDSHAGETHGPRDRHAGEIHGHRDRHAGETHGHRQTCWRDTWP